MVTVHYPGTSNQNCTFRAKAVELKKINTLQIKTLRPVKKLQLDLKVLNSASKSKKKMEEQENKYFLVANFLEKKKTVKLKVLFIN